MRNFALPLVLAPLVVAAAACESGTEPDDPETAGRCTFELTLSGGMTGRGEGPANFVGGAGGALQIHLDGTVTNAPGDPVIGSILVRQWDGQRGDATVTDAAMIHQDASPSTSQYAEGTPSTHCDGCGGSVTIDETGADYLTGGFEITLQTLSTAAGADPEPTTATGTFRAAYDNALSADDPADECLTAWEEAG